MTEEQYRLICLPGSIPKPVLWSLTIPTGTGQGRGWKRHGWGMQDPACVRHEAHGSGIIESEDQHEREIENKEQ